MNNHNKNIGNKGEDIAKDWLEKQGYTIIERNWRHSHWEIDIIASTVCAASVARVMRNLCFKIPKIHCSRVTTFAFIHATNKFPPTYNLPYETFC